VYAVFFARSRRHRACLACRVRPPLPHLACTEIVSYATRELFNRFSTLLSFSGFTVPVIFWAGASTIAGKVKNKDDESNNNSRLDEFSPVPKKRRVAEFTCCQGM
jgi:hypothetical protein